MTTVDRIKALCAQRGIKISHLEKDLGFANGYIGQLRKGVIRADRLRLIADYLSVPTEYLMGDTLEDVSPAPISDYDLKFALWGDRAADIGPDELEDVKRYAAYVAERKKHG